MTANAAPKFMRVATIAALLDCSKGHIWNMLKNPSYNFPPPIKLSPQITVFDAELVERWIEERRSHNLKEVVQTRKEQPHENHHQFKSPRTFETPPAEIGKRQGIGNGIERMQSANNER